MNPTMISSPELECVDAELAIASYVHGDLAKDRWRLLAEHIAGCGGCRETLIARSIDEMGSKIPEGIDGTTLMERLLAALDDESSTSAPPSARKA
jgi:hypothetical protein